MTDYEICNQLRNCVLYQAAEVTAYTSWPTDFAVERLRGLPERLKQSSWFKPVNANNLTQAQMEELGFGRWSEESNLRLIPLWLLPFLQEDIDAECIDGEKVTKVSEMDNDHRFGMLAYGVYPKEVA